MNPSASGWLVKCLQRIIASEIVTLPEGQFYELLRGTGFIYGSSQSALVPLTGNLTYTQQELAKINLFVALVYTDYQFHKNITEELIFNRLTNFYDVFYTQSEFLRPIFNFKIKAEHKLEQLIHKRIQTSEGLIQKNFSHIVTNALLFTDVLTYRKAFNKPESATEYAKSIEEVLTQNVFLALNRKTNKSRQDALILKLIKSSLRYNFSFSEHTLEMKPEAYYQLLDAWGKYYLFDLVCMAVYSDEQIEVNELEFMANLGDVLNLSENHMNESITFLFDFITQHRKQIAYFNFSNPLNHFYQKNQKAVKLLLTRNKNRLYKELLHSKELVYLIGQSTHRELNANEKSKVKAQLFDIFKSIPSLAIFVLPGGSVLLPIIIKFIPQLLPSAFNENNEED